MKILFFIDKMTSGGKERRLTELMKYLHKTAGIDFQLAVMDSEIHYKEVFDLGIPIHYLIRSVKKDFSIFKKFYSLCKTYQPDIVHCWDSMTAVYCYPAWKLLHFKLVNGMVVDTPANQSLLNAHYIRSVLSVKIADRVVGNSNAGLKAYRVKKEKSCCIYNGMDLSRFNELKDPSIIKAELSNSIGSGDFIVGMVAAFEDRKDYDTLIQAARSLTDSYDDIRFVLVGGGSNYEKIRNQVQGDDNKKIIFTGKRNHVEEIVQLFDVGILLTNSKVHGEGISNSIIEYMALSKPVIATTGGGTNEVVFDGRNGFLVNAGDVETIIHRIAQLKNDPELRRRMGQTGREMVEQQFEISKMAEKYIHLYRSLLSENHMS